MELLHAYVGVSLVRAEHVVLLRPLSSVPLTFLATSRYRASSVCFVQLVALPMHLLLSGALALLQLFGCNAETGEVDLVLL